MALTPAETLFVQTHQAPVVSAMKPYLNDAREALNAGGPGNLTPPVISGSGAIGALYNCNPGTWANSPTLAYQWRRTGVNIAGATASTYTTVTADSGASLTCAVTATNAFGSLTVVSNAIALATVDVTPPTVVSFNPLDNATGVVVSPSLVATLSETVVLGATGLISLKKTSDNSLVKAWNVATDGGSVAGKVEVVGGNKLTLYLSAALAGSTEHYIVWDAGVVKDAANNPIAVQASTTLWSFTTVATSSYDPATDAIAAAFTTPPTTARKNLIDACVISLKSAGVWNKLDALYAFAAADSQAALINWKQPGTYNGTLVNAPTFTVDQGFTGASTKYIDTNFNPSSAPGKKFNQDSDASLFAWSVSATTDGGGIIGNIANTIWIAPCYGGNTYYIGIGDTTFLTVASANGLGFFGGSRTDATHLSQYRDGGLVGSGVCATDVASNETLKVLQRVNQSWIGTCAAAGFGSQFSATEHTALYNALRAYMTGVGAVASYTGPGDLVSGATAWYGLRGYSGAYAAPGTNKAINIRRASDNATLDIVIKSDGKLDVAAATTFLAATTGFITKFYDQSGNGRDASQVTAASQPQFLLTGLGSPACSIGWPGSNLTATATIPAVPSPQSGSFVYNRTNPAATNRSTLNASVLYLNSGPAANQVTLAQSLSVVNAPANDSAWHAIQSVLNDVNSGFYIDGVFTAGTTTAGPTSTTLQVGGNNVAQVMELGAWPIAFNATQYGNLNSNQHAYWGF